MLKLAGIVSLFVIATRFFSIYPLLYFLKNGNRVSLLTSINLAQISEFSLVIGAIGVKSGHIVLDIQILIMYIFVITSITSPYMINFSHPLQKFLSRGLKKIGFGGIQDAPQEEIQDAPKDVALLGFFRIASAFLKEIQEVGPELQERLVVVDFNPEVHRKLRVQGVKVVYGDISNLETLHHAGLEEAKLVLSTIPDSILVGTDNLKLMKLIKTLAPQAKIVVTAESPAAALKFYQKGADYVLLPNMMAGNHLMTMVEHLLHGESEGLREAEMEKLQERTEVLA